MARVMTGADDWRAADGPHIVIRELNRTKYSEMALVTSSWLHSYERVHWTQSAGGSDYLKARNRRLGATLRDAYYVHHSDVVNEILDRSRVVVAAIEDDDDTIIGWACAERHWSRCTVIHYAFVKSPFRGLQVAWRLISHLLDELGDDDVVASHQSKAARRLFRRNKWPHVPYLAFVRREGRAA